MLNINIPFFGIDKFYKQYSPEILALVDSSFSSGKVLMGKEIAELENNLCRISGRKYAVAA
ncbi:MAG: hypothetical protein HY738_24065, partial [Bacteroidia bacterium]|nr:hypothetical protein [Bacteroidia bacterium]